MARIAEADELYGLPLERFVSERNALVKRLRGEGRADEAAEVAALRKPSVALWAVNAAARHDPGELRALLRAADRLRSGDAEATGGTDLRRAVEALVGSASRLLEEAGHAASDATAQRVATTLRAAAAAPAGDEHREALARGALPRELEPSGFEAMAGLAASPGAPRRTPAGRAGRVETERRERVAAAERALADARSRERELRGHAERAEREAERARREADRAAAEVEAAERALERARARLTD